MQKNEGDKISQEPRKINDNEDNENSGDDSSGSLSDLLQKLREEGQNDVDAVNELDNLEKELNDERVIALSGQKSPRERMAEDIDKLFEKKHKSKKKKKKSHLEVGDK